MGDFLVTRATDGWRSRGGVNDPGRRCERLPKFHHAVTGVRDTIGVSIRPVVGAGEKSTRTASPEHSMSDELDDPDDISDEELDASRAYLYFQVAAKF